MQGLKKFGSTVAALLRIVQQRLFPVKCIMKNVRCDLNKELRDKNGKLDEKYVKGGGLHFNREGYQVWVRLLKRKKYI